MFGTYIGLKNVEIRKTQVKYVIKNRNFIGKFVIFLQ